MEILSYLFLLFIILVLLFFYTPTSKTNGYFEKTGVKRDEKYSKISIQVEIAGNLFTKARGLMFRKSLAENNSMLFRFRNNEPQTLWMFCTYLNLSAIYFDKTGKIIEIVKMKPEGFSFNCPIYRPKQKAEGVLEIGTDFVEKYQIKIGDFVKFVK